jgi:MoxR-like ATPase
MKINVDYPSAAEEREIIYRMGVEPPVAQPVISTDDLIALQNRASRVFVHHAVVDYVVRLVVATRQPAEFGMADVANWVSYGASPRASLGLIAAGRALALLRGRDYVLPQDVLDVAIDVLPHRMVLSYDAIADGVVASQAVSRVLQTVPLPQVSPRQRAGNGYLPAATTPAPGARVAGAHSASMSPTGQAAPTSGPTGNGLAGGERPGAWGPPA